MDQADHQPAEGTPAPAVSPSSDPPVDPDRPPRDPPSEPPDLRRLTEQTAADLDADRIGVWLLEESRGLLRRIHLHDRSTGTHREGGLVSADRFPAYFRALREEGELAVERVDTDPRVRELLAPYARPLGIAAWLDVPIRDDDGDTAGIFRLEQVGAGRRWSREERRRARRSAASAARTLGIRAAGSAEGTREEDASREPGRGVDSADALRDTFESNPAGIAVLDLDGTVLRCNRALARELGAGSPEELRGTDLVRSRFASERSWRGLLGRLESEDRITDHEVELATPPGESPRWLLMAATLLAASEVGAPTRVVTTLVDVTARKEREATLRRQAYRDPLTGLANRRLLRETAERTLALADRHGRTAGLLYLDLSHFKEVNDTYGHDVGDLVLAAVADRLRNRVRESDLAARVGGDEFAVLMPEVDDERGALRAGRRLLEDLDRPVSVGDDTVRVAGKAGIALYPRDGRDLDVLVRKADRAMYRTREQPGRSVLVHGQEFAPGPGPEIDPAPETETAPERGGAPPEDGTPVPPRGEEPGAAADGDGVSIDDLRRALEREELSLHYQPVVRRVGEEAVGAEALLRWNHPERGLQEASAFLDAARGDGLLPDLDRWALSRAVDQARRWSDAGLERWVAVNVSAETLAGRGLPAFLDDLVLDRGLRRDLLLVDATLTADDPCIGATLPTLRNLRAKGFRVALDYTGPAGGLTGAFGDLPVDVVKMDRRVFDALSRETVAELLDAAVLVKRVETERDYEAVTRRRVPLVQGYFAGRPVPAEELDETG